jgi:hypothetical protein
VAMDKSKIQVPHRMFRHSFCLCTLARRADTYQGPAPTQPQQGVQGANANLNGTPQLSQAGPGSQLAGNARATDAGCQCNARKNTL